MEPLEHFALCSQPVVVCDVASDLEDEFLVGSILAHQQCVAGGAAPHTLDHSEPTV